MTWHSRIVVALATVSVAGCGGEAGSSGSSVTASQARLDESVASVERLLDVLETAYPEGDDSTEAVVDAFSKAMVDEELVDEVRPVDGWTLRTPLPCGKAGDPSLGLIATGKERAFFVGTASESFIAGFAEDGEGDLGVVVARCIDGRSGPLHVAELPEAEGAPLVVAVESFASEAEPAGRAATALDRAYERNAPPHVERRQSGWRLGEPIRCPAAEGEPVPVGSGSGPDAFAGFGTRDVVVVRVQHLGEDIGPYAGACTDGTADRLRQLARPLDDVLEER